MTVLQKREAGFDLGNLGRILVSAALIAMIAAGVVLAVTNDVPTQSSAAAHAEAAVADQVHIQNGSRADGSAQFLAGSTAQTHTGRTSSPASGNATTSEVDDTADVLFYQQAAELTDPADRKFKN